MGAKKRTPWAVQFPNAKLGDERTFLERMKMGIVDSGIITTGPHH
jgi:hypothetical protein